ncbi:unnamed protein product [Chrysoparadoxa australica]
MLVRLAHQCKRLESMGGAPPVSRLVRSHVDTFRDLLESGPVVARIGSGAAQLALPNCPLAQFSAQMNALSERHSNNLEAVMEAQQHDESKQTKEQIDMFLRVNIGIQLLSQHYVSSLKKASKHNSDTSPHQVGVVDTPCIVSLIMEAREQAIQLGQHHLERVPEIHLEGLETATVSCIPAHILHVLFEMLKNSLMATASFHKRHDAVLPPVTVRVSEGLDDVTVSICDQGGGMSRRRVALAYQYLTTSSQLYADQEKEHREIHSYQPATVALSGMGIGLPVSRLYSSHFSGDLR